MIVKNEAKIITRLLDSVIDLIDSFCIVDTGSTDDTVKKIMTYFEGKNKSGKLGFIKFENFEKTRNQAMNMALNMSDYLLLLDADMILNHKIDKEKLNKDYYAIFQDNGQIRYHNTRIVRNDGSFYYKGVTHEVILSKIPVTGDFLQDETANILDVEDGGSKENKLLRDKQLLLENLHDEQAQSRYYFYLANTLTALNETEEAIKYYEKRITKGGWEQELWCCCYKLGCIYYTKKDYDRSMFYFLEAYNYDQKRVENLFYLVWFYDEINKKSIANIYLNLALDIIKNKNLMSGDLFLEKMFYDMVLWKKFIKK
tara:strand:+ start:3365 stop:4303 length:939 start_codon:yes stop_codon:yes gene_type:complete